MEDDSILASWTTRRVISATLVVLAVVLSFYLVYRFYISVFILFIGVVTSVAIRPVVDGLHHLRIPRAPGIIIVYLALLGLIAALAWLFIPLVAGQLATAGSRLPEYYENFRALVTDSGSRLIDQLGAQLPPELQVGLSVPPADAAMDAVARLLEWINLIARSILTAFAILAVAFYWTLEGERITRSALLNVSAGRRESVRDMIAAAELKVGAYMRGLVILSLSVGAMQLIAFLLIGLPYSLVLAIVAGITEAIPVIGPFLGAVPAVLLALALAPDKVIWVIASAIIVQQLENHLLVPRVMDQAVGVNPVVTILAITAFSILFGLAGALLAIPLAAILQIAFDRFVVGPEAADEPQAKGRGRLSLLRLEAQDLVKDVRKQIREKDAAIDEQTDVAKDTIEAIAVDVDSLLAQAGQQESVA